MNEGAAKVAQVFTHPVSLVRHSSYGQDLISGSVGGTAQVIVGHPLDTIKVKISNDVVSPGADAPDGGNRLTKELFLGEASKPRARGKVCGGHGCNKTGQVRFER